MKANLLSFLVTACAVGANAATTINAVNKFAYGANIGWINWQGDVANGAVIGAFVCSGYIYSANVGWIHLGDGTPVNGVRYQNDSAADFGVNHDGVGSLRGYAYGANIGWLTFTNQASDGAIYQGPAVDLLSGRLSGYVWSVNCGWISLSNQFAFVQTDTMDCGPDSDGDGIPDMWELQYAASLATLNGAGDNDGDGFTNAEEFAADTNPLDPLSNLRFTAVFKPDPALPTRLLWSSSPTRQYRILGSTDVAAPLPWPEVELGLIPADGGATTVRDVPATADPYRFFVIEVIKPLQP
jgi:Bacterial TSP3 repeat